MSIRSIRQIILINAITLLVGVLSQQCSSTQATENTDIPPNRVEEMLNAQLGLYHRSLYGNYYLNNHKVSLPDSAYFFDSNDSMVYAKDLFREAQTVFRFSSQNCSECILHEFEVIESFMTEHVAEDLIVIGDYSENAYLSNLEQDVPEGVICLNDQGFFPSLPVDRLNLPYFLRIDSDLGLNNLMILEKSFDRFTLEYLQMYSAENSAER